MIITLGGTSEGIFCLLQLLEGSFPLNIVSFRLNVNCLLWWNKPIVWFPYNNNDNNNNQNDNNNHYYYYYYYKLTVTLGGKFILPNNRVYPVTKNPYIKGKLSYVKAKV